MAGWLLGLAGWESEGTRGLGGLEGLVWRNGGGGGLVMWWTWNINDVWGTMGSRMGSLRWFKW